MDGSIYKRNGVWYAQYRINGKRVQQTLKTRSKRVAERLWADIQRDLDRGKLGLGRRMKSSTKGFDEFHSNVIDKKSPPWRKRMEQLFRPFRTWVLDQADLPVTKMSASDIERFLEIRREQIADKTLNEELAIIKRFFKWAVDREYIAKSPATSIGRYKYSEKDVRIFERGELELIWKHATPYQLPYYQMLLFTGLRDGELRNLEWNDVDLANGQLNVRIKQDWKPKTGRGRMVPICGEAYELLINRERIGRYIFTTSTGNRWAPPRQPWVDLLKRIADKEGVDLRGQVSIHTFRHTFATTCLMGGMDIKTVSDILGHTSIKMTERYLHLIPEHKLAAMARINFGPLISTVESS